MNKTKIPWCDYTVNPVKGLCPVGCPYCYARRMYKRFKWNPEVRYIEPGFIIADLQTIKKPSRIFWGSTFELFHDSVPALYRKDWLTIASEFPQHTHIFLTKCPQNLPLEWPDNCWVGVSATNEMMAAAGCAWLNNIESKVKFLSIEPLLDWSIGNTTNSILKWHPQVLQWLIVGCQTQPIRHPPKEWVDDILKASVPIFVKEPMASHYGYHHQEFPYQPELMEG